MKLRIAGMSALTASAAVVLALVVGTRDATVVAAEPTPAYELVDLPEGLDTLTSLRDAAARVDACSDACSGVVYVWTPRMPLSRLAIPHVVEATRALGVELTLVGFEELEGYAESTSPTAVSLADELLEAGALSHAPALIVHRSADVVGPAILGYKSTDAYRALVAERLAEPLPRASSEAALPITETAPAATEVRLKDYEAVGVPGAYFRWVPGRRAVAYESARRIYLLDLDDGVSRQVPGNIDFVPTPDGRFFVTPLSRETGLAFYDADEVVRASRDGTSASVRPFYSDPVMADQYPSIGILSQDDESIRYRILTSWFEGIRYRDYEIRFATDGMPASARPLGDPVVPCTGMALSTPIMSQDAREVAARDEVSGTTKIYAFRDDGLCDVVLSLGMPTRKVAWHSSGRKLAFSTPRLRNMSGGGADPGIFIYDRDVRRLTRVADSDDASQLAFPDFVGDDAVVFMIPARQQSLFRVVQPIP